MRRYLGAGEAADPISAAMDEAIGNGTVTHDCAPLKERGHEGKRPEFGTRPVEAIHSR